VPSLDQLLELIRVIIKMNRKPLFFMPPGYQKVLGPRPLLPLFPPLLLPLLKRSFITMIIQLAQV
jgi:hypothetical protein